MRSVQEIIKAQMLWPTGEQEGSCERRRSDRFKCTLSARLKRETVEYPVECRDISAGGVCVSTRWPIRLSVGQVVKLKVKIGTQDFADSYDVIKMSGCTREGLVFIRLRLVEPCLSADVSQSHNTEAD